MNVRRKYLTNFSLVREYVKVRLTFQQTWKKKEKILQSNNFKCQEKNISFYIIYVCFFRDFLKLKIETIVSTLKSFGLFNEWICRLLL